MEDVFSRYAWKTLLIKILVSFNAGWLTHADIFYQEGAMAEPTCHMGWDPEKESSSLLLRIVIGKSLKTILKVFLSENKTKGQTTVQRQGRGS